MRIHLLYANPKPDGLCASLYQSVRESLSDHEVDALDLYGDAFDPVKPLAEVLEHNRRMSPDHAPQSLDAIDPYVDRLARAEALVVIFPVWYFGLPAILKGYFDRVLLPGTAFTLADGRMRGRLDRLRVVVGIATYGSPRLAAWWFGDPPRRFIRQQLAAMATRRPTVRYLPVHSASKLTMSAVAPRSKGSCDRRTARCRVSRDAQRSVIEQERVPSAPRHRTTRKTCSI